MRRFDAVRPLWPFVGICLLALLATGLRPEGTDWSLVAAAAAIATGCAVAAASAGRRARFARVGAALPFAADLVVAVLRHSQGGSTSGYAPLAILPVVWVGLAHGPRMVAAITGWTALLFGVPIVVFAGPLYPATGWRSVVLWTVVAAIVGAGANRVVSEQRRLAQLAENRKLALNRVVEAQTAISTSDLGADALMALLAQHAMRLVDAEAACVELIDGDDVVCSSVAGTATPHLGLRLKAAQTITGECFRVQRVLICSDAESDSRVAREACRQVGARSMIVVPLTHANDVRAVLIVWSARPSMFGEYESQLLELLANTSGAALVRVDLIAQLSAHATTDDLTGVANRRAWHDQLELAFARSQRNSEPLTVLLLDLDGFKQINDTLGHAAGDDLLRRASAAWQATLRTTDVLGRLGGDEFAVILERTDAAAAEEVIARLDAAVTGFVRVSTGLAVWDGQETPATLLARADRQMYESKSERRQAVRA
ncbi:MAG: diguanylate cyclase [Frankiaceae bacterium]|nr:diguanylate cyclase [Frankiaceae bacterium]